MSDNEVPDARRRRNRRLGWGSGLLAAGAIGGAVLAGALPASAASPSPSTTSESTASGQPAAPPTGGPGGDGPVSGGGQRSDETVLTGTLAAQAKAAALKAVPGATVVRVETDADGATYEAHLKKADGSLATVKFDKDMAVTAIQAGMGSMKQRQLPATAPAATGAAPDGRRYGPIAADILVAPTARFVCSDRLWPALYLIME